MKATVYLTAAFAALVLLPLAATAVWHALACDYCRALREISDAAAAQRRS